MKGRNSTELACSAPGPCWGSSYYLELQAESLHLLRGPSKNSRGNFSMPTKSEARAELELKLTKPGFGVGAAMARVSRIHRNGHWQVKISGLLHMYNMYIISTQAHIFLSLATWSPSLKRNQAWSFHAQITTTSARRYSSYRHNPLENQQYMNHALSSYQNTYLPGCNSRSHRLSIEHRSDHSDHRTRESRIVSGKFSYNDVTERL